MFDFLEPGIPGKVPLVNIRLFLEILIRDLAETELAQKRYRKKVPLVPERELSALVDVQVRFKSGRDIAATEQKQGDNQAGDPGHHDCGTATPTIQSRVTSLASAASSIPSVPSGRIGKTR